MWAQAIGQGIGAQGASLGQYYQAEAARQQGDYNSDLLKIEAGEVRRSAEIQERDLRESISRLIGTQRAAGGNSGLSVGDGRIGRFTREAAFEGERDALTIRYAGERDAYFLLADAANERAAGRNAQRQGYLGAATTLLSMGSGSAGSFSTARRPQRRASAYANPTVPRYGGGGQYQGAPDSFAPF